LADFGATRLENNLQIVSPNLHPNNFNKSIGGKILMPAKLPQGISHISWWILQNIRNWSALDYATICIGHKRSSTPALDNN